MESQVSYLGLHPEQEAVFMATCIRAVLAAEITNHAPPPPPPRFQGLTQWKCISCSHNSSV